ncbi:TolC family protein [Stieleria sp. TO1_6]|uniref:TolC family protein n=1 Tax=Stieleria tagensis TaxID=2956795 RepID=UPI00209AD0A2|nr:TolC family protein [Stieleria tagensis]MCO8120875.1 TolC family protein [Stieleria tagensis]
MEPQQNTLFLGSRKRHRLGLSLFAVCLGGCVSGPDRSPPSQPMTFSSAATDSRSADTFRQDQDGRQPVIQTASYGDDAASGEGVLVAGNDTVGAGEDGKMFEAMLEAEVDTGVEMTDAPHSGATASDSRSAPVEYFVDQALAVHPSLRAARQRVSAELQRVPQVTALPDPQFNNTFWPLPDNALQTAGGRIANQMSLQQGVPFPDKLRTKGAIVTREAQIAQAEVEQIERQITESVRLAYYEVWYATRAYQIIEETQVLVDDLTRVAEARYRAGGTQQDVLRAQLETDRLDDQLVQLKKQKEIAQADLAALLQQPVSLLPEAMDQLGVDDAPQQLDALIAQAEQCNPSLRGLAAEIQRDRQTQRLACLQKYPDFTVGLNWGIVSDGHDVISPVANGNDNLSIMFGTTLPIWRDKINAGVREANLRTSSSMQRYEAERNEIFGRLRRLLAQADSLVEQNDIYRDRIIPRTEDTLKLAIADYRGERSDFFTLIETYRELLMFEIQLARINATLAGTVAQIDRTVGCTY